MAADKYFDLPESKDGITLRVYWREDYDETTSKPSISITDLQFKSSRKLGLYYLNGSISVDGTNVITFYSVSGEHCVYLGSYNSFTPVEANGGIEPPWVATGISGTKATIDVNISGISVSGASIGAVVGSEVVELIYTGIVNIDGELYQCFVDNGSGHDLLLTHIEDGTKFELYSG